MRYLVTGAAGFVASHLVSALLAAGHHVRGTVRDPANQAATRHLRVLAGADEQLELVAADLNDPHAFDVHVAGMDGVFHTASPYRLSVKDPQRDLVDPAVNGTRTLLAACAASPTIKRVVLTSSMAAITDEPDGQILTEADWNTRSTLRRNPYYLSKAEAERAAWNVMDTAKPAFDLVVINPFLVIGPSMTSALNPSNQVLADLINGVYPAILSLTLGFVDVRDVALAHFRAMTTKAASGRYICAAETRDMAAVVALLARSGFADRKLPRMRLDSALGNLVAKLSSYAQPAGIGTYIRTHVGRVVRFDNSKIRRDLGITFRDVDASIVEAAGDLRHWGNV